MLLVLYEVARMFILYTVPVLGLTSGGGVQASGLKISSMQCLLLVVILVVFFSLSPCIFKACILAVSLLAYLFGQCQH